MNGISYDPDTLTYTCRGCHNSIRGVAVTKPSFLPHDSQWIWLISKCSSKQCGTHTFIIYDGLNNCVHRVYPFGSADAESFHSSIPEKIREDLAEARLCMRAGASKGAVVMLRRVVQAIALNKLGKKKIEKAGATKLWQQIDLLAGEGLITKQQAEAAHEVRHFGNFGAHPSDDNLDGVKYEELNLIDGLVDDLLSQVYVEPYKIDQLRKARREAKEE